jgi:hypothetical protein
LKLETATMDHHHHHGSLEDTSNDESIARALAAADREAAFTSSQASIVNNHTNNNYNNPLPPSSGGVFTYPGVPRGRIVEPPYSSSSQSAAVLPDAASLPPPLTPPFAFGPHHNTTRRRTHMCHVPCIIGYHQTCVEMMVDTGAESSVISLELARDLGLDTTMDRRTQGVASGVGTARILGTIRDVVVTFGHVEFLMQFIVLEIPGKMLLLGMDQMRKYNCIINLQRDVLIFGGTGGVEVPMLPPDRQPAMKYARLGDMCLLS